MATGFLAPAAVLQPLDDSGNILPGGLLDTYDAGTTTPRAVYTDMALTVPAANPVVLDAAGRCTIYLEARAYKFRLRTAAGATLWTVDNVLSTAVQQSGLGEQFVFGGDPNSPVTVTSYPSGTGGATLHPGSGIIPIDSANLVAGATYRLEAMLKGETAGTITLALVNLTDGSPDTPLVTISNSSTAGVRQQSGAITFPSGGASKDFAVKSLVNAGAGFAWNIKLTRTA